MMLARFGIPGSALPTYSRLGSVILTNFLLAAGWSGGAWQLTISRKDLRYAQSIPWLARSYRA
jgi:hypothetical protein